MIDIERILYGSFVGSTIFYTPTSPASSPSGDKERIS